jgi:DNA-binding sugar fermentation-stimulating protein
MEMLYFQRAWLMRRYKRFGRREIADVRLPGERRASCPWRGRVDVTS